MSHQVPEHYVSLSERLSHIFDNVGYSRENRNSKVTVANDIEVFVNIANAIKGTHKCYLFGSRGEGSTGPGLQSDSDYLYESNEFKVVTNLSQCQSNIFNLFMVQDNHTHPGYVKLQSIRISSDYTPVPVFLESDNVFTAIDSLYRTVVSNTAPQYIGTISGPAVRTHHDCKELSYDRVYALRCPQWPQDGYEWFLRRRLHGWPTPIQIENARKYGCFVTPVGHPHSSERLVEWRLSFSIAERELTRSFEDTTMQVYILLKMIRKTYIEPVVGDAFSSYHCKVCMFWIREITPHELWCKGNLVQCLILCIRQLYEWATIGFCPDYFIVTNNIYDRKMTGAERNYLVQIFRNLLSSSCTFLLGIKFCNLGQHVADGIIRLDYCVILIAEEERFNLILALSAASICRSSIIEYIPQQYSALVDYLDRIKYASKYLPHIMQYPLKHAMMIILSQLGFHIANLCLENAHILSQEEIDYLAALASGCLSFGINIDATSVRLKMCGLGMILGNRNLIETSLQDISDYHMRCIFSASTCPGDIISKSCIEKLCRNKFNTERLLRTQTSFSVVYLPTEMSITPKPLRMEMFRSIGAPIELKKKKHNIWFEYGVVDTLMCLYFFQYMNFSRLGKDRHKQVAIDNMIYVICCEPDIVHRDTAFNLLGYSFMQENQMNCAYRCFRESLNIRLYHNAAKFFLGILFKRIHAKNY